MLGKSLLCSSLLLFSVAAFAESERPPAPSEPSHDGSAAGSPGIDRPAPPRRPEAPSASPAPTDLVELAKQIKELPNAKETGGILDPWWTAAHKFLDELQKKETDPAKAQAEATKLADGLAPGKRQDLFKELVNARFIDDPTKLRNWINNASFSPEKKEAAKQDIQRRLKDPTTKLVAELFHMRPELAMLFVDKMKKAKDGKEAAPAVAKLFGTLNKLQRENVANETDKVKGDAKAKGLDERVVKWLNEGAGKSVGKAVASNPFVDEFDSEYKKVQDDNKKFHELVKVALGGDAKAAADAKKTLFKDYDPESVMDFIGGQMNSKNDGLAVDVARAFAKQDDKGELTLGATARNAGFGDKDRDQSLYLGNKDKVEEVRAALHAFLKGADHTGGELTKDFDVGTTNRFHLFGVGDPEATPSSPKRIFAEEVGGEPALRVADGAGRPAGKKIATRKIETPSTIPNVPDPKDEKKDPPPGGGAVTLAAVQATVNTACMRCHGAGSAPAMSVSGNGKDLRITVGTNVSTLAQISSSLESNRSMASVPDSVKAQFKAWAAAQ